MTTTKLKSFSVHSRLVKSGEYNAASRLLRSLISGATYLQVSFSDNDWKIAEAFGFPGATSIRIK